MFVVCAGPWHSVTWEHAGPDGRVLPFGWHARRSLATELERDADELRRITESCFDHYATIFTEPYAFDSFDQAFVPGQNWGALESPGCVTYRDEILPIGRVSEGEARRRAMVIAHEMAHMWFGNLVTMTWWEDTWLQESFADYMGFRVAETAAGFEGTFVDFTGSRKVGGYDADERRSTHPVAPLTDEVGDVDAAANNFDSISYAKGNSVLRQLVTWLGDEAFLAGVNVYLGRHRLGNATLADFVDALDGVTDRDVRGWVEHWLRTTGFDTLRVERDVEGPVLFREGTRPHRVRVSLYDDSLAELGSVLVDVADEPVRLPDAAVVVPNSGGETFARIRLDRDSWAAVERDLVSVTDPGVRSVLWSSAFDLVRCGELSTEGFLGLVTRHLPRESNVGIVESVLAWVHGALVPRHLSPEAVPDAVAQVAAACEAGLASSPAPEVALVLTRGLAATTPDAVLLEGWLVDRVTHTGIDLDQRLRWMAIHRLAALGAITPRGDRGGAARGRDHGRRARRCPVARGPPGPGRQGGRMGADVRRSRRVEPRVHRDCGRFLGRRAARAGGRLRRPLPGRGACGRPRARPGLLAAGGRPGVPSAALDRRRPRRPRGGPGRRPPHRPAPQVGRPL